MVTAARGGETVTRNISQFKRVPKEEPIIILDDDDDDFSEKPPEDILDTAPKVQPPDPQVAHVPVPTRDNRVTVPPVSKPRRDRLHISRTMCHTLEIVCVRCQSDLGALHLN